MIIIYNEIRGLKIIHYEIFNRQLREKLMFLIINNTVFV